MTTLAVRGPAAAMRGNWHRIGRGITGLALTGALAVQGCASIPAGVNADDACSIHRKPMVEAQERFNETIAVGAISGALVGALIGGLATGDVSGAIVGGIAGGLTGAAAGYMQAKQQQYSDRAAIVNAINQDVRASYGYVTTIGEGVRRLNTCRANEVNDLRRRIQAGQTTGEAARSELAVLRSRIADDRRLINAVMGDVDENAGVYADSLAKTQGVERDLVVSANARRYQPVVRGGGGGGAIQRGMASSRGATRYATAGVNVRSGPGTNNAVIGTFGQGQRVGLLGDAGGGWSLVDAAGRDGYVATRFLSSSPVGGGGGATTASVPKVDKSRQPRPTSDLDGIFIEASNIKAEDAAFEASISQDMEALELLVQ